MKCIIYCRKSTEGTDRQALSLESQLEFCRGVAKKEGLEIIEEIQESRSAKSPGRPGFAKMLTLIEKGKADCIISWRLARLARNVVDGGAITYMLTQGVIKKIFTESGDFLPDTNTLLLSVHFGMSSQFSIELKREILRGMKTSIEKGNVINKMPRGYKRDKATGEVIFSEVADYIKDGFKMRAQGSSLEEIRKFWVSHGFKVAKSVVDRIMKNRFYYGFMFWQGEYYKGNYKPLITKELFDKVNAISRGATKKQSFPLKGIVQSEKGRKYLASIAKKKYTYYHLGKDYISEDEIIETFEEFVVPHLKLTEESKQSLHDAVSDFQKNNIINNIDKRNKIETRLQGLRIRKNNLFDMRIAGEIESEAYIAKNTELHNDIIGCEEELSNITSGEKDITQMLLEILELLKNMYSMWKKADRRQKILIISMMAEKIYRTSVDRFGITLLEPFSLFYINGADNGTNLELFYKGLLGMRISIKEIKELNHKILSIGE